MIEIVYGEESSRRNIKSLGKAPAVTDPIGFLLHGGVAFYRHASVLNVTRVVGLMMHWLERLVKETKHVSGRTIGLRRGV